MPTFPSITPSDFDWLAPEYEQVEHETEDGGILHQVMFDTPGNGGLSLTFQNRPYSDYEAILAIHDQTYGSWGTLTLPMATWGGRKSELRTVIATFDPKLEWAFADEPTADGVMNGVCNIQVKLKNRIRPIALSLSAPTLGTPVDPTPEDPGTPVEVDTLPVLNCNIVIPIEPDLIGCQDIWMSRMTTYTSNVQGKPAQAWKLLPDGTSYATFIWTDLGTAQMQYASLWLVLVKRDKDGNILWIRETASFKNYNWETTTNPSIIAIGSNGGVLLACRSSVRGTGTLELCTRYWRIDASGNQLWEKLIYRMWGSSSSSYAPYGYGQYIPSQGEVYYFDDGSSSFSATYTLAVNEATGAYRAVQYGSTNGTTGQRPMHWTVLASNGTIVGCGARDSKGRIFVIDPSTLGMTEEYIYTGSIGFEAILDYDASNYLVSETGRTKYHLVSKTSFDIVASWNIPTVPGVGYTSWLFCKAENGLVYHAGRSVEVSVGSGQYIAMTVMDVAAQVAVVKNYTTEFRLRVSSSSTQTAGVAPGGNGDYVVVSADVNMLLLAFSLSRSNTDQPQPDEDRVFVVSLGTKLPVGTYDFYPHAGAQHLIRVGVTATNTPFTSAVIPVKAVLAGYTPIATTPIDLTGEELAPFAVPVPADKHQFALVRDAVCPPKFWTSRLNVPIYSGLGYPIGSTAVLPNGDSYSIMQWADVGAVNNNAGVLLTKRDKDGVVLWQRKTSVFGWSEWFSRLILSDSGVIINISTGNLTGRMWHVSADGTQICAAYYPYADYDIPLQWAIHEPTRNEMIGFATGPSDRFVMASYSATTGAVTRWLWHQGTGLVQARPLILPNGNILIGGGRAGIGWLMELSPNWTQANFPAAVVQSYVYTGMGEIRGMCLTDSNITLIDASQNFHVVSIAGLEPVLSLDPTANPQSASLAVQSMVAGANGIVHLAVRGNMLWDVDIPNQTGAIRVQNVSGVPAAGRTWQFENSGTAGYTENERTRISPAAKLGVAWMGHSGGTEPNNDTDRFQVVGLNTDAGVGTWVLKNHPPYDSRTTTASVSATTTPLVPRVLPTKTVAAMVPVFLQNFSAAQATVANFTDDTTFTWDLQTYEFT